MLTSYFQPHCLFLCLCMLLTGRCLAGSDAHDWAKITTPSPGYPSAQSIGGYTNGCVKGAAALPLQDTGYQVMRLSRHRYYGHPELIQFIQKLGQTTASHHLGTLLIGDLGQPRGGPTLSGHRSHQTGLDVDIWFMLSPQANQRLLTTDERENWSAPSMVNLQTDALTSLWTPGQEKMLELVAEQAEVDRVFVNPGIKQALCRQKSAHSSTWLRKIRPWWKHDDHFHVRLKCPANSPDCDNQEPLPAGNGCDASLAWWFSAEAKNPPKTPPAAAPPPLPVLCEQLLTQ